MNKEREACAGPSPWIIGQLLAITLLVIDGTVFVLSGDTGFTRELLCELAIILILIAMLIVRPILSWHGWLALLVVLFGMGVVCVRAWEDIGSTLVSMAFTLHVGVIGVCLILALRVFPLRMPGG
jgi:hypothetical protein